MSDDGPVDVSAVLDEQLAGVSPAGDVADAGDIDDSVIDVAAGIDSPGDGASDSPADVERVLRDRRDGTNTYGYDPGQWPS